MNYTEAHDMLIELREDLIARKKFRPSYTKWYAALVSTVKQLSLEQRARAMDLINKEQS